MCVPRLLGPLACDPCGRSEAARCARVVLLRLREDIVCKMRLNTEIVSRGKGQDAGHAGGLVSSVVKTSPERQAIVPLRDPDLTCK